MPTNGGLIGKETHIKKVASNVTTCLLYTSDAADDA